MDLQGVRPTDEGLHPLREQHGRPVPAKESRDAASGAASVQAPRSGGPLASGRPEAAPKHDGMPTDEEQTQHDRQAKLNDLMAALQRHATASTSTALRIEVDPITKEPSFFVVDRETGEVLRQIPEDETKRLLAEVPNARGLLLDQSF